MPWSVQATEALYGRESDQSFSVLLSIEHEQITDGPLRLCLNEPGQDLYSNLTNDDGPQLVSAAKFTACYFQMELAQDTEQAPTMKISVQNVDRKYGQTLLGIRGAPTVYVAVVLMEDPNNVLTEYFAFKLRHVSINALTIEGELIQANLSSEPYPFARVTELRFPALFSS